MAFWSRQHGFAFANVALIAGLLCCFVPIASASESATTRPNAAPDISVKSYFREIKKHSKSEPLLIQITLANSDASNVAIHNQRVATKDAQPLPVVVLGSETVPISKLISVTILPRNDFKHATKAAVLACSKNIPAKLSLDGSRSLTIYFGVDKEALSALAQGNYIVRAQIDTRAQPGMWQGQISEEFDLELVEGDAGSSADQQAALVYSYGKFYLLDHQFDNVEPYAMRLEKQDANSIGAAELRGDAALSCGHYQQAADLFKEAIRRENTSQGADKEPPVYLYKRWQQATALLGKSKSH